MVERIRIWLVKHNISPPFAWAVLLLSVPVVALIGWAVVGVVGNRADDYLEKSVTYLMANQSVPGWWSILLYLVIYIGLIIGLFVIGQQVSMRLQAQGKYRRANMVLELALLQLAVLVKMLAIRRGKILIVNILDEFLTESVTAFSEGVYRASVFRPDTDGKYLEVWSYFGYDPTKLPNNRYSILPTYTGKRGVAGYAFRERCIEHDRISRQPDGKWMGVHPHFVPTGSAMHEPRYKSFVAAPIKDSAGIPRAVLCIDSDRPDAFDDAEDLLMVDNMAAAIGPVILAYYVLRPSDAR